MSSTQSPLIPAGAMYVIKRNGERERMQFDKITARLDALMWDLDKDHVFPELVAQKINSTLFPGVKTSEVDELAAEAAGYMIPKHPDYAILAARILVSNLHKQTPSRFSEAMEQVHAAREEGFLRDDFMAKVAKHRKVLDAAIDHQQDFQYDFFAMQTLLKSYLNRDKQDKVVERPQYLLMRVALALNLESLPHTLQTYKALSQRLYTHATPTLFNAGRKEGALASCYLSRIPDDSLDAIYDSVKQCALISKGAGGVGLAVHDIRAAGTLIKKSGGRSNGLVPMLKVFEATARYVDQCFHPSTIVYTKAGPKPIGNVAPLDKLVTSDGSFASVGKILHHPYQGPMLKILVKHSLAPMLPMSVTPQHPFYAVCPKDRHASADFVAPRLESGLLVPEFVEAEKLALGDWIGFPIPQYEQDVPDYSLDDCRMWGIMLGCGVMATETRKVEIFLEKKTQQDTLDFVIHDYLAKMCIQHELVDEDNFNCTVLFTAPVTCKFNAGLMYDEHNESIVAPHLLHLPLPKISALLRGFLEAHCQDYDHDLHVITSRDTMQSWRYILLRLGVLASGYYSRKEFFLAIPKVKVIADLLSLKEIKKIPFVQHNGVLYSPIETIESIPYSGVAVDFEMNGKNKDYLTEFGTVHNGGNKRKGAFAIYLEPWHADVEAFLDLRKNTGIEQLRTRDLFTALWVPDLFMKRVENDENWSLFSPDSAPGLSLVYGEEFDALYTQYEEEKRAMKVMKARTLWNAILDSQRNTGTPYVAYKDAVNRKSNQKNLGTIQCSNLCCEITEYTSKDEVAVCNLASINLEAFVEERKDGPPVYNFDKLGQTVMLVVRNSNAVIDVTYYPIPEARHSNLQHRPIGVGVQNLAGAFFKMQLPFASEEAQQLNRDIFETMYYHAVVASAEEAERVGPYKTFPGSPMSKGLFQFDLWNVKPSDRYDFDALRTRVIKTGVRNSLLIALMPTATTSQILGGFESFEPIPSNLFVRRTQAGEFIVVNKYLVQDLQKAGLWTPEVIKQLVQYKGSVQQIEAIPVWLRDIYKTVWEVPAKVQIDMSADRGPFVCQTQSLNIHMENVSDEKITKMHFWGWKKGLKTGMYYLRTTPAADPIQFTVDQQLRLAKPASKKAEKAPPLAPIVETMPEETKSASEEDQPLYCSLNSECTACHG
jgi:ribonucleoside-diphosphate reductase alpha subunit